MCLMDNGVGRKVVRLQEQQGSRCRVIACANTVHPQPGCQQGLDLSSPYLVCRAIAFVSNPSFLNKSWDYVPPFISIPIRNRGQHPFPSWTRSSVKCYE